jgi:manganese-transporting P-type ATPase
LHGGEAALEHVKSLLTTRACAQEERQSVDTEFKPNLVNTVCYIVQNATQLLTFAVNYVGHPFQTPLRQNSGMIGSLRMSCLALLVVTSGAVPMLNKRVQLVPIPTQLKMELFVGVAIVIAGSVGVEHWLRGAFPAYTPPRKGYMNWLHLLPEQQGLEVKKAQ